MGIRYRRVYVLANGSRKAHAIAKECNVLPCHFVYVKNAKMLDYLDKSLFLLDESFSNNKNYLEIKNSLKDLKEIKVLKAEEYKRCIFLN